MKTRIRRIFLICAALTLGVFDIARAEDFTFTIPIRITNLSAEVGQISMTCQVFNGASSSLNTSNMWGGGATYQAVDASGGYTGNIIVKFNASKSPASSATHYLCRLGVHQGTNMDPTAPSSGASQQWAQPKPGTTFTDSVAGTLP
jgi:hypothetical protein